MQHSVESPIGFADGKIVRIEKLGMKVLVVVHAWDKSTIAAEFDEAIGVKESMAFELSDLVVTNRKDDFINWCTQRAYEGANSGGEKTYQFLDFDGQPCLEIVAKSVSIVVR